MELFLTLGYWILVTGLGALIIWCLDSRKQIVSRIGEGVVALIAFGTLMFLIL